MSATTHAPVWGRTIPSSNFRVTSEELQLTPPRGGRTILQQITSKQCILQLTPPRGGRTCANVALVAYTSNSPTHTPAWGRTGLGANRPAEGWSPYHETFNSRPRCSDFVRHAASTRAPVWGRTGSITQVHIIHGSPTHAPRVGANVMLC